MNYNYKKYLPCFTINKEINKFKNDDNPKTSMDI
jgi:hypothetical protein